MKPNTLKCFWTRRKMARLLLKKQHVPTSKHSGDAMGERGKFALRIMTPDEARYLRRRGYTVHVIGSTLSLDNADAIRIAEKLVPLHDIRVDIRMCEKVAIRSCGISTGYHYHCHTSTGCQIYVLIRQEMKRHQAVIDQEEITHKEKMEQLTNQLEKVEKSEDVAEPFVHNTSLDTTLSTLLPTVMCARLSLRLLVHVRRKTARQQLW